MPPKKLKTPAPEDTMRVLAGKYLAHVFHSRSNSTWRRDSTHIERFIEAFKHVKYRPEDFVSTDIQAYLDGLKDAGRAAATRHGTRKALMGLWKWLIENNLAKWNPAAKTMPITVPRRPLPPFLAGKKIAALLKAADGPREKLLVLLPLTTGVSPFKLASLTWAALEKLPLREDVKGLAAQLRQDYVDKDSVVHRTEVLLPAPLLKLVLRWSKQAVHLHWAALLRRAGMKSCSIGALGRTYQDLLRTKGTWEVVPKR